MPDNHTLDTIKFSRQALGGYNPKEVDDFFRQSANTIRQYEQDQHRLQCLLQEKENQISQLLEQTARYAERLYKHRQTIQELIQKIEEKEEEIAGRTQAIQTIQTKVMNLETRLHQTEEKLAVREQELYRVKSELAMLMNRQKEKRCVLSFSPLSEDELKNI